MIVESYLKRNDYWDFTVINKAIENLGCFEWYIMKNSVLSESLYDTFEKPIREWESYWNGFNGVKPTLRWLHEDDVVDLFMFHNDGTPVETEEFLKAIGMKLSLRKGGFVLSKRMSRTFRRYLLSGFYKTLNVKYMKQTGQERKIWDGAGVISRRFLKSLVKKLPEVMRTKDRKKAMWLANTANRIEYTIVGPSGQDKGHAIVSDSIEEDFILPMDTKSEIAIGNQHFVGIDFPHSADDMKLDFQSLVNMGDFFRQDNFLMKSLKEYSSNFLKKVEEGKQPFNVNEEMLDGDWFLPKFIASGGIVNQYPSTIKSAVSSHLTELNETVLNNWRLPVHGGRYYVMTSAVGEMAFGMKPIPQGHCKVDPEYSTLWVNNNDWIEFISGVTGGADHDDAYWVIPFTSKGEKKILAWRSPNQMGEYVVLAPTEDSHEILWESEQGPVSFQELDAELLPKRLDRQELSYIYQLEKEPPCALAYSVENMQSFIEDAANNIGVLGGYCNTLMVCAGLFNSPPNKPPLPLEEVVDATVKTGNNLSQVKQWLKFANEKLSDFQIPLALQPRLKVGNKKLKVTEGHWLDQLANDIEMHIASVEEARDVLITKSRIPAVVINNGAPYVEYGEKLFQAYTSAWKNQEGEFDISKVLEQAQDNVLKYLAENSKLLNEIVLGSFYYGFHNYDLPKDTPLWFNKTADYTMEVLRNTGVLGDIIVDGKEVSCSPIDEEQLKPIGYVKVTNAWFNLAQRLRLTDAELPSRIPEQFRKSILEQSRSKMKAHVEAKTYTGLEFRVEKRGDYQVLVLINHPRGEFLFGYVSKSTPLEDNEIIIKDAKVVNNDLLFMI